MNIKKINIFKYFKNILINYSLSDDLLIYIFNFIINVNEFNKVIYITYEKKDRISKDIIFDKIIINKYEFIVRFINCILTKYYILQLKDLIVIPYMRMDISYFKNPLININFFKKCKFLYFQLFILLSKEFSNIDNYYSIYYNFKYYNQINILCKKLCKLFYYDKNNFNKVSSLPL